MLLTKIMILNQSHVCCMLDLMPARRPIAVSFEFFPPADDAGDTALWETIGRPAPLGPRFVSVTDGTDGSTRTRTPACVRRIAAGSQLTVVPHLTCVSASRDEVLTRAADYWRDGHRQVVALRGDARQGATKLGFAYAADLVHALRQRGDFGISVAAYPEGHPESASVAADVENLGRKIAAGANRGITQFFFDSEAYLRYRDRCAAAGIDVPIVPGILPIVHFGQMRRFAARCGAVVPARVARRFAGLEHDPAASLRVATEIVVEQVRSLRSAGVDEFHFYTLNRAALTLEACRALGLRSAVPVGVGVNLVEHFGTA